VHRKPLVIVISGPSGAGKSTLVEQLLQHESELRFSVSATTRERRPGEQDGREYHFLSEAEFRDRIAADAFLEHAEVHGARYGTLRSEVEAGLAAGQSVLLDVDVQGGIQIKRREPAAVLIFVLPPSMRALEERLRSRKTDSEATIQRRLRRAPDEIRALREYDYVVVNGALEAALRELQAILTAERLRRSRLPDGSNGPDVVEEYLRESAEPFRT
jgi:guanylate kinase